MEGRAEIFQLLTTRLHDAAIEGDVPSLLNLLHIDPFILDRRMIERLGCFMQSPLHIAAKLGHLEFTKEILSRKPELAEELDHLKRWSPLHMASAKGYLEIVKALLEVNSNMCFTRDQDGKNPFHIAAINGQIHVLDELFQAKPQAAMERTSDGETVLHLCVKHSQPEALIFLANVTDDGELLNSKDRNGNTVLHLAVAAKQPEIVKFLLKNRKMERNAINTNGSTAMDIFVRSKKDVNDKEIKKSLQRAKQLRAKYSSKARNVYQYRLEENRSALMVVASLIATMAFQVGINPPGGVWQDTKDGQFGHTAGLSVMADISTQQYDLLVIFTVVGFVSSLSVILLLISGLPCKRLFVGVLMITMWIAVTATTLSFFISISFLSALNEHKGHWLALIISLSSWLLLMFILLLTHVSRYIVKLIKKVVPLGKKLYKRCFSKDENHPTVI